MDKRVISILRPIVMALLIAAAVTFTVLGITTATISDMVTVKAESVEHSHDGITFNAWTKTDSLPSTAGDYYLTADVTLSASWMLPSGTTKLCLNGHGIKMTGNNSVVTINAGATLKLYDCDTTTEHKYSVSNAQSNGAGFATVNDSLTSGYNTFVGGYITGGKGKSYSSWKRGGAFYIEGAVEVYGGTIIGNGQYANTHGGGFNTQGSGTFKMYGGSIQNNAGQCGGATRLQGSGSCEIYGGKIINNIVSADGGGIHVGGAIPVILQDCEISGNYAGNGPGAGIWMTTTGTEISGRTIITNNLTNSGQSNVEIGNGYVISVGELTEGASVGIKINNVGTGTFTSGWATFMGDADPADYFTSDAGCYVVSQNGEAVITDTLPHIHDGITFTAWTSTNSLPSTAGNYYLTANVSLSSAWSVPSGASIIDLNGYNVTRSGTLIVVDASTLTIIDCQNKGKIYNSNSNSGAIDVKNSATVNFKGCIVESKGNGVGVDNSTVNVYSGSFSVTSNWKTVFNVSGNATLNVYGGTIRSQNHCAFYVVSGAVVNVEGGSIKGSPSGNVIVTGGYFDRDVSSLCASGYICVPSDDTSLGSKMIHKHVWTYDAESNVITANCTEDGCNLSEQTLTINAVGKTYDGTAVIAQLVNSTDWTTGNGLEIPTIYYSDGVNAATTTAPVNVGTYTASITVGEKTATVEFEITRKTETKIDDKTGDEENNVTVVGLDLELSSIEDENPDANSISLVMTVETKTDETAVNADSIIETAKNKSLEFFEIKVKKTVDSISTTMSETSTVMEIVVPYEKVNKRGLIVYSYHDGVRTFVESDAKEDGTFRVDKENKLIYIYANKFSTYAIGYTPYYRVQTSLSLGSYEGKASVTIKNDADENISFTLESADAKNIVFPDVPKGQYTMTIIWEDGKTNTLTMTLTVGPKAVLSAITEQDAESETPNEQVEEQETQVYSPDIGTTDESEILTEDAKIETVAAENGYVAYKAQAINREVGLVPRKREYMIKRENIFYI